MTTPTPSWRRLLVLSGLSGLGPALEGFQVVESSPATAEDRLREALLGERPFPMLLGRLSEETLAALPRWLEVDSAVQVIFALEGLPEAKLPENDRVVVVRTPFHVGEVRRLALALASRWLTERDARGEHEARQRIEAEHRLGQKLEAVGQLAAGIAHEINTPMQYIGDSVQFLRRGFQGLQRAVDQCLPCVDRLAALPEHAAVVHAARAALAEADLDYVRERGERAFERTLEGVERVSTIVNALREFAHPGPTRREPTDLNHALASALVVCRNEYKYVAEVEQDLGPLPLVECHPGEINQVFLNLLVNAAHAIEEVVRGTDRKGRLRVQTRDLGDHVLIAVEDTGPGIPEAIRERIFDPFFTTKPVGRGTGQGLAICRSIVVDKHRGRLRFESEVGRGTRFVVELPVGRAELPP